MVIVNLILYEKVVFVFIDFEFEMWNMLLRVFERVFEDVKRNGILFKVVIVVNLYG